MFRVPDETVRRFDAAMDAAGIGMQERGYFQKWLRYYLDFCDKYRLPSVETGSLVPFLEKLGGKGPHRSLSALQAALAHRAESTHRLLDLWGLPTLTISYKKSLADPVGTAAAVNRFLGGTLDETAMAAAVDATQYRSTAK